MINDDALRIIYNNLKGADWPSYENFKTDNFTVTHEINQELEKFRRDQKQYLHHNYNENLKNLYDNFGENICLFPFFGVFTSSTSVKPCCVISGQSPIVNNNLLETVNLPYWKDLRKKFLEKSCHDIPECKTCSLAEKNNTHSTRLSNNQFYSEHFQIDIVKKINEIVKNNFTINEILSIQHMPSNVCDFECIMCYGESSSKRFAFEHKYKNQKLKSIPIYKPNDLYNILHNVEILSLTGGETILEPEVSKIIDYVVSNDLAKNISLHLLTNASTYPTAFEEKFSKFKKINYVVSLDGIGDILEYQRRGANWNVVKENSEKIIKNYGAVINCVVTAVNIFRIDDFFDYCYNQKYTDINFTLVYQEYLKPAIIPTELKKTLYEKLDKKKKLLNKNSKLDNIYINLYNNALHMLQQDAPNLLQNFIHYIKYEDLASKRKLKEILPEWKPYFD